MIPQDLSLADAPIAVFDSGVGGLTVMRAIVEALPNENIVYLGDTARVPYGNRGAETICRYALNATHLLVQQRIKALVIACNTATAYALPTLSQKYDMPIFGVVEPVAKEAARLTCTGEIGVLGTRATVRSQSYPRALNQILPQLAVHQLACPLFVPMAEEGWTSGPIVRDVASHYLEAFKGKNIDTIILGCTHYPLLLDTVQSVVEHILPHPTTILTSANSTAITLKNQLAQHNLLRKKNSSGTLRFLLTDIPEEFLDRASAFFGQSITSYEHVDILDIVT